MRYLTQEELKDSIAYRLLGYELHLKNSNGDVVECFNVSSLMNGTSDVNDDVDFRDYYFNFIDADQYDEEYELSQQQVYELLENGETMIDDEMSLAVAD